MEPPVIRVGIADDHPIVRSALKQFFLAVGGLDVVAEATHGSEALAMVRDVELDVLVLDLDMPGQGGLDVIALLRSEAPRMGILVLSAHPEQPYAVNLIRLGAAGYLNKQCEPEEIVRAVHAIAAGERYVSPTVAGLLAQEQAGHGARLPHELLSDREFQVFSKLARGEGPRQIGLDLSLSSQTVSAYRCRLMDKMGLKSNSDLTRYALEHRLLD